MAAPSPSAEDAPKPSLAAPPPFPEPGAEFAEQVAALQAATRVLTGVALRSLDVLDGVITLPQFRMLADAWVAAAPGPRGWPGPSAWTRPR